ncbi:MAG TPA: phosphate ABC transporter permease, partial [Thermoanaerobaculia bacterium]|nr:phosphate ABC transporter permease [Thermoanaerobaculia bacterium]
MNDVRHHLFLLRELVKRDFQGRYAGSLLGFVWSFVQPLWMLALFTFVFSTVMRVRLAGGHTQHFSVFLFSGLLPWMALQEGVLRSSTAVTDNASL